MTKEELLQLNGKLQKKIDYLEGEDRDLRTDFSKILDAPYKPDNFGYGKKEIEVYSWYEIFFEIGKLKGRFNQEK